VDVHLAPAARGVLAGCSEVIFHISGAQHAARVNILKTREISSNRAFGHVQNHIQPSAMAHAHDQLDRSPLGGPIQDLIQQRQKSRVPSSEKRLVPR